MIGRNQLIGGLLRHPFFDDLITSFRTLKARLVFFLGFIKVKNNQIFFIFFGLFTQTIWQMNC